MNDYFEKWKINLNKQKKAIFFTRRRKLELSGKNITVLNSTITWQPSVKYLGLNLDKHNEF